MVKNENVHNSLIAMKTHTHTTHTHTHTQNIIMCACSNVSNDQHSEFLLFGWPFYCHTMKWCKQRTIFFFFMVITLILSDRALELDSFIIIYGHWFILITFGDYMSMTHHFVMFNFNFKCILNLKTHERTNHPTTFPLWFLWLGQD